MLDEDELRGVPLLVFANKQDVPGAVPAAEVSEELGLVGGENARPWSVRGCCAIKGEGLHDGLDWSVISSPSRYYLSDVTTGSCRPSRVRNRAVSFLLVVLHLHMLFRPSYNHLPLDTLTQLVEPPMTSATCNGNNRAQ
jgi:hypothetical protein